MHWNACAFDSVAFQDFVSFNVVIGWNVSFETSALNVSGEVKNVLFSHLFR